MTDPAAPRSAAHDPDAPDADAPSLLRRLGFAAAILAIVAVAAATLIPEDLRASLGLPSMATTTDAPDDAMAVVPPDAPPLKPAAPPPVVQSLPPPPSRPSPPPRPSAPAPVRQPSPTEVSADTFCEKGRALCDQASRQGAGPTKNRLFADAIAPLSDALKLYDSVISSGRADAITRTKRNETNAMLVMARKAKAL